MSAESAISGAPKIAVDVAGGDHGVGVVVEGAVHAHREFGIESILVGDKVAIQNALSSLGVSRELFEIVHAPEVIGMEESPSRSVRRKPNSSLCLSYQQVQEGKAVGVISTGNSGAMMAAGSLMCGLMPGIERPAIATLIPGVGDTTPTVILDAGANVNCQAHNLVQFAVMGRIYCSSLLNVKNPRVALLSNGTEASKGTDVVRQAAVELSQMSEINYIGFVEGRDVATDNVDVVVCDGFVGNVLLKAMEGCVRLIAGQIKVEAKRSLYRWIMLGACRGILRSVFTEKFDYAAYGGAPLLGLNSLGIVLHGSSDERAVKNAIKVAKTFYDLKMVEKMSSELARLEESRDIGKDIFSGVAQ